MKRQHQLRPRSFPERLGRDERLEIGHELARPSAAELDVEPFLERGHAQRVEPVCLVAREPGAFDVRERGAAPERERGLESRRRLGG